MATLLVLGGRTLTCRPPGGRPPCVCDTSRKITGGYARGVVHTNNMESFWSLLKRGIVGSYHKVSKEHLPAYVSEFEFRFNNRNEFGLMDRVLERCH